MGIIKEPLDMDFEFDPKPLTKLEKEQISNYIKAYKSKHSQKQISTKQTKMISKHKKVMS